MRNKLKLNVPDITRAIGRDKSTIYQIFRQRRTKPKQGQPGRPCRLNRKAANHFGEDFEELDQHGAEVVRDRVGDAKGKSEMQCSSVDDTQRAPPTQGLLPAQRRTLVDDKKTTTRRQLDDNLDDNYTTTHKTWVFVKFNKILQRLNPQ